MSEVIRIVFTDADVEAIADDHDVSHEEAKRRAHAWASSITDTAVSLVDEQLTGAIVDDQP